MGNILVTMHTTSDYYLINHSQSKRNFITFLVSVCLLVLLLMVPVQLYVQQKQQKLIALELIKAAPVLKTKPVQKEKKPVQKTPMQPLTKQKEVSSKKEAPKKLIKTEIIIVKSTPQKQKPKQSEVKPIELPSTAVLLNTIKNRQNTVKLGKEFQAKTGHEEDFVYKSVEQAQMFKEFKLINEEVDKPEYEMNFYAEGIEGSVERFMDKITYKKTFTTRFGTKIQCASVAIVITACGWK